MKKVVTVQDISCVGKCSCTAALPIISASGIETLILPTALLSAHTDGFGDNTFLDLTEEMKKIISHWKSIDLSFDGIYSGYLGKTEQIEIVSSFIEDFKKDGTLVVIDPVMGDGGRLYKYFEEGFVSAMRGLCKKADVITPNTTEACMLTDTPFFEEYDENKVAKLFSDLFALGARNIVVTGIRFDDDTIGYAYAEEKGKIETIKEPYHKNVRFAGTGDVFTSALTGLLIKENDFPIAVRKAAEFTESCIDKTDDKSKSFYYGLAFEDCLHLI
ncbi:MAG: pyridoxamine kinase [Clostridia bacterium]|nr:pyridoxamine kinase [Clostridia bacterium]